MDINVAAAEPFHQTVFISLSDQLCCGVKVMMVGEIRDTELQSAR